MQSWTDQHTEYARRNLERQDTQDTQDTQDS